MAWKRNKAGTDQNAEHKRARTQDQGMRLAHSNFDSLLSKFSYPAFACLTWPLERPATAFQSESSE